MCLSTMPPRELTATQMLEKEQWPLNNSSNLNGMENGDIMSGEPGATHEAILKLLSEAQNSS